jgi:hypothetical protein
MLTVFVMMSHVCYAEKYDRIEIYPKDVGVFTTVKTQQFVAFGHLGEEQWENITEQVRWISSNEKVVEINDKGLATVTLAGILLVRQTGFADGIVNITASYPKANASSTGVNLLLLNN